MMNTVQLTVPLGGAVVQLPQGLPEGTSISNGGNGAVWLGNNPGIDSGMGFQLNPQASFSKLGDAPLYATIDNAATSPGLLIITTEGTNFQDPEAIAIATATQLLANGVPNVLVNDVLRFDFAGFLANQTRNIDTHKYSSLTLLTNNGGAAGAIRLKIDWYQSNINTGPAITYYLTVPDVNPNTQGSWSLPVIGGSMTITNLSSGVGTLSLLVYGTNRSLPNVKQLGANVGVRSFTFGPTNVVAGTGYNLVANDGEPNMSTFNGPVKLTFTMSNGITITPSFQTIIDNGGYAGFFASSAFTSNNIVDFYHPSNPLQWSFIAGATQANYSCTLAIVPATSG